MNPTEYRGFQIHDICPPIPSRSYDFQFFPACDDEPDDDGHFAHGNLHGWGETEESCKKQIDELLAELEDCKNCCGVGYINYSCCWDDITGNDYDNCPSCGEHCSTEEEDANECEECHGTGKQIDNP